MSDATLNNLYHRSSFKGRQTSHGFRHLIGTALNERAQAHCITATVATCNEMTFMALTRDFKETVIKRVQRDPAFAKAMLDEAATLFLNGEPDTARVILRDLVNATVGFETLAEITDKNSKSLHRMLSATGNPTMDNLAAIFSEVRKSLKVKLRVHTDRAA